MTVEENRKEYSTELSSHTSGDIVAYRGMAGPSRHPRTLQQPHCLIVDRLAPNGMSLLLYDVVSQVQRMRNHHRSITT